jgi:hypothetical protein
MLCKRTYKNQITLPKKVMENFEGVEYFRADIKDGKIVLDPVRITSASESILEDVRRKAAALGLTDRDVEDAIAWARKN